MAHPRKPKDRDGPSALRGPLHPEDLVSDRDVTHVLLHRRKPPLGCSHCDKPLSRPRRSHPYVDDRGGSAPDKVSRHDVSPRGLPGTRCHPYPLRAASRCVDRVEHPTGGPP